ncbi:MAG: efflux RND transporter periplasmic adaptor subunit [Rikenellaceae bacterium]
MEKGVVFFLLLSLSACNNGKSSPQAAETSADTTIVKVSADTTHVDAITSATSKPNQISFNGTIVIPPQRHATVSLTIGGVVENTSLLSGQYVKQGDVLATLKNPDFIALQQTYLDSYAQSEYLLMEYDRQKALSSEQAASQKKFQQSKADYLSMKSRVEGAAAQLSLLDVNTVSLLKNGIEPLLQVKSPISGYISNVAMNIGRYIQPGEVLCEVIDKSAPMLCLTTYEKDLVNMKIGSPVQFRVNGMGTAVFQATVTSIGQKVDQVNRSLEVYASIKDGDPQFRPGMYVTARIQKK